MKSATQVFCTTSASWYVFRVFLVIRLGLQVFGKKIRKVKGPFCITSYQGYKPSRWLITVGHYLPGVMFVRSLHPKALLFSLFSVLCSLGGSSAAEPILKECAVTFHLVEGKESEYIFWILLNETFVYSLPFIYSLISISYIFILYFEILYIYFILLWTQKLI